MAKILPDLFKFRDNDIVNSYAKSAVAAIITGISLYLYTSKYHCMKIKLLLPALLLLSFSAFASPIQNADTLHGGGMGFSPLRRHYFAGTLDGLIFSTASISSNQNGQNSGANAGTLRFTGFVNIGITYHYNFSRHLGFYTGVDIKNVGYIDNVDGYTIKRRTYNIGVPLGIKVGNMSLRKPYLFAGGGLDVPFNFKEKKFPNGERGHKVKFNEWFSNRTPALMPYVFAGVRFSNGISVKLQYYISNYLNTDYSDNGVKIYAGDEVHLMLLSLGYIMPRGGHNTMKITKGTENNINVM